MRWFEKLSDGAAHLFISLSVYGTVRQQVVSETGSVGVKPKPPHFGVGQVP